MQPPSTEIAAMAFHDQLAAAKRLLVQGRTPEARALLEGLEDRLDAGERPPGPIAREALVYLGDVRFLAGELDGTREAFRRVLLDDPEHVISPYHHTQDVRAYFALVREQVRSELANRPPEPDPPPLPSPPPLPVWSFMPLGAPQFRNGQTGRGIVYGGLQVACATGSIASFVLLSRANRPAEDHPFGWEANAIRGRVRNLRYGLQWPTTAGFYIVWTASVLDGTTRWRKMDHTPAATVWVGPEGVRLSGRF